MALVDAKLIRTFDEEGRYLGRVDIGLEDEE